MSHVCHILTNSQGVKLKCPSWNMVMDDKKHLQTVLKWMQHHSETCCTGNNPEWLMVLVITHVTSQLVFLMYLYRHWNYVRIFSQKTCEFYYYLAINFMETAMLQAMTFNKPYANWSWPDHWTGSLVSHCKQCTDTDLYKRWWIEPPHCEIHLRHGNVQDVV